MSSVTNHVVGFIGKCKRCKSAVRYDISEQREYVEPKFLHGVSYPSKHYYCLDGGSWYDRPSKVVSRPCQQCGALASLKRMQVTYNEKVKCGAKCRNATGPACECSCRGVNHGRG